MTMLGLALVCLGGFILGAAIAFGACGNLDDKSAKSGLWRYKDKVYKLTEIDPKKYPGA